MTHNIDKEVILIDLLAQHRGKPNAITAVKVAKYMTEMGHPSSPIQSGTLFAL